MVGESGKPTLLFAFDDPFDNDPPNIDSMADLFALSDVELGQRIVLGRYALENNQIALHDFNATLIVTTKPGHFGNPAGFMIILYRS